MQDICRTIKYELMKLFVQFDAALVFTFFFRVCLIFLFAIFVINRQKQDDLAG